MIRDVIRDGHNAWRVNASTPSGRIQKNRLSRRCEGIKVTSRSGLRDIYISAAFKKRWTRTSSRGNPDVRRCESVLRTRGWHVRCNHVTKGYEIVD